MCRDVELDSSELGSLPDRWEIRYTANGRRYFVNHLNRTTQFTGTFCLTGICIYVYDHKLFHF